MEHTFGLLLSVVLAMVFSISFIEAAVSSTNGGGFHIELVHRESPLSPFYNHSETDSDRFTKSILRSMSRANHISTLLSTTNLDSSTTIVSRVIPAGDVGSYLMNFSIGTPPIEVLATADTGSDVIWTQCKPCVNCYKQDVPVFDPETSSTYRELSCESLPCKSLQSSACENNTCEYSVIYGDESIQSNTTGNLATETFTFDSTDQNQRTVLIPTLVFGCGHNNVGNFSSHGSGIVGLGGGNLSLVTQLGSKIDGKFSYCLVNMSQNSVSSKLNFGSQAIILGGNNVVSTPLVSKNPDTFYFLTLEAISVGDKRLENIPMNNVTGGNNIVEGNIVIDSGTTLTMLPVELYNQVETAMREANPMVAVQELNGTPLKLCYSAQSEFEIPDMIFHFTGADVRLPPFNTFQKFTDLVCMTMIPTDGDVRIFGNLAQMNFLIEYDLVGRKVSFAPADCTKY